MWLIRVDTLRCFSAEAVEDGYRNESSVGHSDSSSASGKRQHRHHKIYDVSLTASLVSRSEEMQTACFISDLLGLALTAPT